MKIGEIEKIGIREPLAEPLPTFNPFRKDDSPRPAPSAPEPAPAQPAPAEKEKEKV